MLTSFRFFIQELNKKELNNLIASLESLNLAPISSSDGSTFDVIVEEDTSIDEFKKTNLPLRSCTALK